MRARWMAAVMAMIAAAPAAAQEDDGWGLLSDSAGIPADTVRLPTSLLKLGRCGDRFRVVSDSAGVRYMRGWAECKRTDFGDLSRRTLVGVPMSSECDARFRLEAWRSGRRREYRVRATIHQRPRCRIYGEDRYRWMVLPRLPSGWKVGLTLVQARGDADRLAAWGTWVLLPQPSGSAAR